MHHSPGMDHGTHNKSLHPTALREAGELLVRLRAVADAWRVLLQQARKEAGRRWIRVEPDARIDQVGVRQPDGVPGGAFSGPRLLKMLLSNCTFDRGSLSVAWVKPFDCWPGGTKREIGWEAGIRAENGERSEPVEA